METREIVKKLVDSLIESRGHAYASGYLESKLVDTIERFVTDEAKLSMLHIELLSSAIDHKLDKKAA